MPFKRNGKWFSDIRLRGRDGKPTGGRVRKLLPLARNKAEAKDHEHDLAKQLNNPEEAKPREPTFAEFCRDHFRPYAEQNRNHSYVWTVLRRLEAYFGDTPISHVSVLQIERYKRQRAASVTSRGGPPKNSSLNTEIFGVLSAVMALAHTEGLIRRNPCHDVAKLEEEPAACPRLPPGSEEERALLAACLEGPDWLAPLVTFALGTGMRREEMLKLKWEDVDFGRNLIFVQNPKWRKDPRKTKGLPFGSRVRSLLLALPRRGEYVFTTKAGRDVPGTTFQLAFTQARERAGLTFNIHALRHEYGSRLGDADVSPYRIARLMGHSSIKMSMRYVHPKADDLFAAVEGVFGENGQPADTGISGVERKTA